MRRGAVLIPDDDSPRDAGCSRSSQSLAKAARGARSEGGAHRPRLEHQQLSKRAPAPRAARRQMRRVRASSGDAAPRRSASRHRGGRLLDGLGALPRKSTRRSTTPTLRLSAARCRDLGQERNAGDHAGRDGPDIGGERADQPSNQIALTLMDLAPDRRSAGTARHRASRRDRSKAASALGKNHQRSLGESSSYYPAHAQCGFADDERRSRTCGRTFRCMAGRSSCNYPVSAIADHVSRRHRVQLQRRVLGLRSRRPRNDAGSRLLLRLPALELPRARKGAPPQIGGPRLGPVRLQAGASR